MVKRFLTLCFAALLSISPAWAGMSVWQSGAWHNVPSPKVWQSGAWRTVQGGWVWQSGAWRQFFNGCTPVTHTYTSSGTETVPTGVNNVQITVEGRGGTGGNQQNDGSNFASGGGGGAGGDSISNYSVSSGDWSGTLSVTIAATNVAHGPASVGTPTISVPSGTIGGGAPSQFSGGSGSAGSTGSGGNSSNSTGASGSSGSASTGSVLGGSGGTATLGYGNGGAGADSPGSPNAGGSGVVIYQWTC